MDVKSKMFWLGDENEKATPIVISCLLQIIFRIAVCLITIYSYRLKYCLWKYVFETAELAWFNFEYWYGVIFDN